MRVHVMHVMHKHVLCGRGDVLQDARRSALKTALVEPPKDAGTYVRSDDAGAPERWWYVVMTGRKAAPKKHAIGWAASLRCVRDGDAMMVRC